MRTLKRTMCLVLAMVMLLGLCAIQASAVDSNLGKYPDQNQITYKEAVDVLTGIDVMEGDANGFRPTDKVTRAEAAAIITRREAAALLGISEQTAYARLREMTEDGILIRINFRYYSADRVIAADRQRDAVLKYLETSGPAYLQEVAELLHIEKRSVSRLLRTMVKDGKLTLLPHSKRYGLPEKAKPGGEIIADIEHDSV